MTGGMDNPVHVVFTPGGERIFTTTFFQNPANGQRDGIIHAVYGGIYGKVHDVIDNHPHTSPDVMPVLVQLGPAAACGLCRYESDAFGPDYRDNLFATSFNLHKVTRHVLKPDGATFLASNDDFLVCDSVDFHPTDVIEDADGSLLVIDTGGWYKLCCPTSQFAKPDVLGAIYRVKRISVPSVEDPRGLKIDWASLDPAGVARLLDDPRPFVRRRAVHELGQRGVAAIDATADVLRDSPSSLARLNAVWAATWIDDAKARTAVRLALHDRDETVRQAAAHSASVWQDHGAFDDLLKLSDTGSAHNRRVAAEALGRLADGRAVPRILAELARPNDRVLDHSLTYALIEIGDAKSTAAGLASDSARVRRSAMIALDQIDNGGLPVEAVATTLSADDSALRQTATWIAGRHPEWGKELAGALGAQLDSSQDPSQLATQLSKLARSGAIQGMLAERLNDPKTSPAAHHVILQVVGESGLTPPPQAWLEALTELLQSSDEQVLLDATSTIAALKLKPDADPRLNDALSALASDERTLTAVRMSAFAAIPGELKNLGAEEFRFLRSQLQSNNQATRLSAARAMARARLDSEQLIQLARSLQDAGPLEIDPLLSAFAQTSDAMVGDAALESLQSARAFTALRADAVAKYLAPFAPRLKAQIDKLVARLNPDTAAQQARLDQLLGSLPSGDVRRGQALFNSAKASCSSCHQIGYVGGRVGPDLTRVGAIRTRRDLLESVMFPSASFVQSFEPTMVILKNGDRQYGIVRRNDDSEVMLVAGPNQDIHIARKDVQEMRPGTVSIMPAGFADQLSAQELGDLIAFLQACK
jgi:putative heme-binding domain-containing protein